jgi:glycosyltransferase involved in cell wall biosynthesis
MRLLHLIHTPRHSGAEMLVYNLCKLHRAWGHECAIASFAPPEAEFAQPASDLKSIGVELFFPPSPRKSFGRIAHFRDAVRRFRPDIVFAHSELPSLYGRFATGFGKARVRYVSVLHSATTNDFSGAVTEMAERRSRFRVDHVVTVSKVAADNYQRRFGTRVPVSVIRNGVDLGRFQNVDRDAARTAFGLAEGVTLALQVGRISDVKQQGLTLRVLRPWLESGHGNLWFAGLTEDPVYESQLRNTVQEWGLGDRVRFLGSRSDVPELLAAADLYFMPSKQEAHSVAMLEALASGIPIVASDIPAFGLARSLPGVRLCRMNDESAYQAAIADMLTCPRAVRNISEFAIERTASEYLRPMHTR